MARGDKRHAYFSKLCKKDRILKWLLENNVHGGYYNYRLDQLRGYAGIDRYPFHYYSPDFWKQPDLVKRLVSDTRNRLYKKYPHRFENISLGPPRLKKAS